MSLRMISMDMNVDNLRTDKKLAFTVVILRFILIVNIVLKSILPLTESMWGTVSYIGFAIGGLFLLIVIPTVVKREFFTLCVAITSAVIVYCVSIIQNHGELESVFSRGFWTIAICIPIGVLVYTIEDKRIFYSSMLKASYLMTALITLVFLFNWFKYPGTYSMSFSYSLLYPLLFHLNELFNRKRKVFHLVLSACQISIIMLYGSRGALLCIASFIIIKSIVVVESIVKKLIAIILTGSLPLFFYIYFDKIGNFVLSSLFKNSFYSRTMVSFFNREFLSSSGRNVIQSQAINMIMEKPFAGWGVGGEVDLLGTYPHNIFLEFCLNFGLIWGGALCLILVVSIFATFFASDGVNRDIFLIYLCAGFIPLLLSSTYLKSLEFYILVFLMIDIWERRGFKNYGRKYYRVKRKSLSRFSYG